MNFRDICARWLGRSKSRCHPAMRRQRTRLCLSRLEDREVPANFSAGTVSELVASIDAANLTPEADTITLTSGTTFTLTSVNNTTNGPNGLPAIAAGEELTIVGNGAIVERSSSKGTPGFRLITVSADASLTLANLTLQGGLSESFGGAVYNSGTLTMTGVTVQENAVKGAPGHWFYYWGSPWFLTNGDTVRGGGLYSDGTLTMDTCTIRNNTAIGGDGAGSSGGEPGTNGGNAYGGGVYIGWGAATVTGCSITGNSAKGGKAGAHGGSKGSGIGGGIYIAPAATLRLDIATIDQVNQNKASTSDPNIFGVYDVIS